MRGTAYRTGRESCASCGAPLASADAYLSSNGPVCPACHKAAAAAERTRNQAAEANTSALLGGIFAALAGITLFSTGLLLPYLVLRPCLIAVFAIVIAVARVPRMRTTAAHGTLGKRLVKLGAVAGAIGAIGIVFRFLL